MVRGVHSFVLSTFGPLFSKLNPNEWESQIELVQSGLVRLIGVTSLEGLQTGRTKPLVQIQTNRTKQGGSAQFDNHV